MWLSVVLRAVAEEILRSARRTRLGSKQQSARVFDKIGDPRISVDVDHAMTI